MTAEEIRTIMSKTLDVALKTKSGTEEIALRTGSFGMLAEIAAQMAELNENVEALTLALKNRLPKEE